MRVALIGDVHANLPALEAVLVHAREQGVEAIWNVGDSVGYGAFPDQVVQRLRKEDVISVLGDRDSRVLRFKKNKDKWRGKMDLEEYLAVQWAYEQLGKKSRKYLRFLSGELRMRVVGRRICLTHASPVSGKGSTAADAPEEHLLALAREVKADLIVCGHPHEALARQAGNAWFINPGSTGLPRDGDPRASYAILEIGANKIQVQHYRVAYDVDSLVAAIREQDLPEVFAQMFLQGRDLEGIATT
jgi:putative phosphoesterase